VCVCVSVYVYMCVCVCMCVYVCVYVCVLVLFVLFFECVITYTSNIVTSGCCGINARETEEGDENQIVPEELHDNTLRAYRRESLFVCVYCVCILTCLYACILVYLYTCMLAYLYACMLVYLYACILVCLCDYVAM
jgi:hypothetical protein